MAPSLTGGLRRSLGALFLAFVLLTAVATVAGLVVGFVAMVLTLAVTVAFVGLVGLAAVGLFSLLVGDDSSRLTRGPTERAAGTGWSADRGSGTTARSRTWRERLFGSSGGRAIGDRSAGDPTRDPADRIRDRYLAGDIDESEFERQMERLFETADLEDRLDRPVRRGDRDRVWER